jgi:hypothetical protein
MPALAHQHCLNHPAREAAGLCLECRHFFCRECVTEHDERLLCAACLRKLSQAERPRGQPFAVLGRISLSLAGFLTATLFFYWVGQTLLLIPTAYHDGSLWTSPGGANP